MNYSQFALATTPENIEESTLITPTENENKNLEKALIMERLNKGY